MFKIGTFLKPKVKCIDWYGDWKPTDKCVLVGDNKVRNIRTNYVGFFITEINQLFDSYEDPDQLYLPDWF